MLDNINMALKIMPGYNTEKNVLFMKQSNDVTFINNYLISCKRLPYLMQNI